MREREPRDLQAEELPSRVVNVNRVAKVVKGGRRFSFSAIIVVGDGSGQVGVALGKAREVPEAIRKGTERARKSLLRVPLAGTTVPHEIIGRYGSSRVLLRPAVPGTGVIAGGAVRAIVESAGIRDVLTKSFGSPNPHNVVRATMAALRLLEDEPAVARRRSRGGAKDGEAAEGESVAAAPAPAPAAGALSERSEPKGTAGEASS
ncbi:MAG: 30S ribosomal protein S5 [Deltaproteobacteria bacterium]|nr:30S ribosomal protein S5 [Deltaproteobacteria bacterium]